MRKRWIIIAALILLIGRVIEYVDANSYLGVWNLVHLNLKGLEFPSYKREIFLGIDIIPVVLISLITIIEKMITAKKSMIKRVLCVLCHLIVLSVLIAEMYSIFVRFREEESIAKTADKIRNSGAIVHAGGYITGKDGDIYDYTNSIDALDNAYNAGNKIIEIDFYQTDENNLICYHPHENDVEIYGFDPEKDENAYQRFLNTKVYGEFSTMSINELADYLRDRPDLLIVTDVKGNNVPACKLIAELYPDLLNRFIVQIYHESEYNLVRELGFKFIILTLYRSSEEELNALVDKEIIDRLDLVGLTFWADWVTERKLFYSDLSSLQVPLCVHTVNDKKDIKDYLGQGISCVYTDNTENLWIKDYVSQ